MAKWLSIISVALALLCLQAGAVQKTNASDSESDAEKELENAVKGVAGDYLTKFENPGEWSADVETYEAPELVKKTLPYYIMGYDFEDRPVFVWEVGRWDIKKLIEMGYEKEVYKHSEQMWYRMSTARQNTSKENQDEVGAALLVDGKDFPPSQFLHLPTLSSHLQDGRWGERAQVNLAYLIGININFVARTWINIVRPVAGKFFGRLDVHSPVRERWEPILRANIPADQLSPWYGGKAEGYKPVKVFY